MYSAIGRILYLAMPRAYRKLLLTATVHMTTSPLVVFGVLDFFGGAMLTSWLREIVNLCFVLTDTALQFDFLNALVHNLTLVSTCGVAWLRGTLKSDTSF